MKEESDFKKITIIGVGLIGGSLGLALKKKNPKFKISGIDKLEIIEKAIARGAIDEGTINLENGIKEADIIIIATPVKTIIDLLPRINSFIKKGCIVTDTGSTKGQIAGFGYHSYILAIRALQDLLNKEIKKDQIK